MKNKFLPVTIFILGLFTVADINAQSKRFFAVTGEQFGSTNWISFRQLDLDGRTLKTIYVPAESNELVYDAENGSQLINLDAKIATPKEACGCLNSRMVAAIAYDAVNNRLYYTQMLGNQLRYLDLNSAQPRSYAVTSQLLKNFAAKQGEGSVITRMVMASDGNGYALTNDNEHLIRFTTGKKTRITDLGNLIDAKSNGENSIKQEFKTWGGDMIADASGNLYLFTMQRLIYKINPATRVATFIGQIKNIPEDYSINAAMVADAANVVVGSSTKTTNYYRVNLNTLEAAAISRASDKVYNVSDFANEKFAFDNKSDAIAKTISQYAVNTYPNPVTTDRLNVQFSNFKDGKYVIQLNEMQGKSVLKKEVKIKGSQTESITVASITAGMYAINVINDKGEIVYSGKVIVSK